MTQAPRRPLLPLLREETRKACHFEVMLYFWILPLVGILGFGLLYARRVGRDFPITVVDLDQTYATRTAVQFLDATPELRVISVVEDEAVARKQFERQEVLAVVTLPHGLLQNVKHRRPVNGAVVIDSRNLVVVNSVYMGI
ncbi:MAG TPA: ABC transporter permease, partial [Candidatus Aminicenantes bacterium]|nr:ABC transporter permease [Candidatus Aminicenantes bacterium]